jgi:hypothetical protein
MADSRWQLKKPDRGKAIGLLFFCLTLIASDYNTH